MSTLRYTQRFKAGRWACSVIIILVLSACAASELDLSLDFPGSTGNIARQYEGVLGVDEFIDLRPQLTTSDARKWLGFIPGVLWVEFITEIPDTYTVFSDYKSRPFTVSFARAIFADLERSGIFEKVVFLPKERYARVDYRLEGALNRTFLKETGYYYGSGLYAWVTRIFGLPYVSYEFSVDITLRLRDVATNEIIWVYELEGDWVDKYNNVYRLSAGRDGKHILSYNISKMLEKELPIALESLEKSLQNI
ncbi:MAG: hypothetical protein ACE5GF_04095 [Thermodesulfobacteriota bacterium]